MASVRLTRVVEFEAAHRIRRPDKSEAENRAAFGKAAADHAHRYQVRVTVRGPLVAEAGGVVKTLFTAEARSTQRRVKKDS